MIHVWLLSKLIIIDMEKFKLADFKVSSIRIDDMLNVMGGSGGHTHNEAADKIAVYRVKVFLFELF